MGSEVSLSPQGDNSNVQFFAVDFRVIGIRLEDMPGLPAGEAAGLPSSQPAEPVIAVGKTADTTEITVVPQP